MRAIAVLCVVGVHVFVFASPGSPPIPAVLAHLNVGVTIFFLISGFLLYRPMIAHRTGGPPVPRFGRYARRRALRILPAYWLALTVLTIIPGTVGVSGGDWLTQYSLLHTLPLTDGAHSCVRDVTCGLAQTWSLAVEASFYLALPFLYLLSERIASRRPGRDWVPAELAGLAVLSIASVVLRQSVSGVDAGSVVGGTLLGYFIWFALGMVLAVGSVALEGRELPRALGLLARFPSLCWGLALVIYGILCASLPETPFLFDTNQSLWTHLAFGAVALLLVAPAIFADPGATLSRRVLGNPVLAWLGLVSYGIFLWHYVVAVELGSDGSGLSFWPLLGATLGISVTAAAVSYYALERPLLRLK